MKRKIQEARNLAGSLGALSPQQTGTRDEKFGGQEIGLSHASQYLYEKRPFPQFDGQKRNFPSFWREWTETVTKKYPPEFELQKVHAEGDPARHKKPEDGGRGVGLPGAEVWTTRSWSTA